MMVSFLNSVSKIINTIALIKKLEEFTKSNECELIDLFHLSLETPFSIYKRFYDKNPLHSYSTR